MRTLVTTYDCAIAFPETSLPKFSSESNKVTINPGQKVLKHAAKSPGNGMTVLPSAFFPSGASPFATSPFSFRSIYQLSVAPAAFFRVKAKIALPFLTASLRSASLDFSESLMRSKAADDGKSSAQSIVRRRCKKDDDVLTTLERHCGFDCMLEGAGFVRTREDAAGTFTLCGRLGS